MQQQGIVARGLQPSLHERDAGFELTRPDKFRVVGTDGQSEVWLGVVAGQQGPGPSADQRKLHSSGPLFGLLAAFSSEPPGDLAVRPDLLLDPLVRVVSPTMSVTKPDGASGCAATPCAP